MDITSYSLHAPSAEKLPEIAKTSNQGAMPTLRSQVSSAGHEDSALDTSSVDSLPLNPLSKEFLHSGPREFRSPSFQLRSLPNLSERRGSHRASGTSVRPVVVQEASETTTDKKDSEHVQIDVLPKFNTLTPAASIPSLHFQDAIQTSPAQAAKFRRNGRIHFAALCWTFFLQGWNDGSTGPLLPKIQSHYNVGFVIVSLIFVTNCIGFIVGACANVWLNDRIGLGKVMVLGSLCQLTTYIIQSPAPPFVVMVLATGLAGFGMSLQNAQANGFVGSLKRNMSTKLGILHASYGLGAFTAPLVATHFSEVRHWSFHYIISTGIAVSNVAVLCMVFRGRRQDEILADAGQEAGPVDPQAAERERGAYRQIMGIRAVHFLAIFALIYVGVEVTVGGWIVTFIIRERDGGSSAGYISSGFFGGITVGRLSLMWVSRKVGEHRVVFVYALLAIALEVTVWVVPSIIENGVAVSFIGLLLGPLFPLLISHTSKVIPRRILTGALGWISGIGMAGSAALPFATGLLAARYGISSLQPLLVSMMVVMVVLWAFVPIGQRRVD